MMKLHRALTSVLLVLLSAPFPLAADKPTVSTESTIPATERVVLEAKDLQLLGMQMKQNRLGLVIMFHAEYCDYCERLEHDLLQPMVRSGDYDNKVLIRKIQVDGAYDLTHFNGETVTSDQLASHFDASLTPTLVFVDADGTEQAERILGYNTPDLFGAYLDQAIDQLHQSIIKE